MGTLLGDMEPPEIKPEPAPTSDNKPEPRMAAGLNEPRAAGITNGDASAVAIGMAAGIAVGTAAIGGA
jgi:hypothetical protein